MAPKKLFIGSDYNSDLDYSRLTRQVDRILGLMKDGEPRTLSEIKDELEKRYPGNHFPESSISAQLRNLRKPMGGSYRIEKRRRGNPFNGLFEYQLILPDGSLKTAC